MRRCAGLSDFGVTGFFIKLVSVTVLKNGVLSRKPMQDRQTEPLPYDRIVLAYVYAPEQQIAAAVKEQVEQVYVIGEAVTARGVQEAMTEASTLAGRYTDVIHLKNRQGAGMINAGPSKFVHSIYNAHIMQYIEYTRSKGVDDYG
ncbi:MAG TPA: hypothetical protein VN441_05630 [Syntrophomonas sp.]|nr:hypothetical protein [Syntrophomonas sp.]